MTEHAYAIVKRAFDRTRSNATMQSLGGLALTAALVILNRGFPWWVIAFIVLNTWVTFVMGRRWLRLRKVGPVLLKTPAEIVEIRSWPPKVPPNRMPLMLEVVTKDGAMCPLLLDAKKPADIAQLVGALHTRSPSATLAVPNVELPKPPTNESSPAG